MGCDIHFVVQRKTARGWIKIPNTYYDSKLAAAGKAYDDCFVKKQFDYDGDRHYYLFAWLANVRQGSGFKHVEPLTDSRGLPRGVKPKPSYQFGDHSFGWARFDEILNHPRPPVKWTGLISLGQYQALKNGQKPESWCGWASGDVISSEEADQRLDAYAKLGQKPPADAGLNARAPWVQASWEADSDGLDRFCNAVQACAEKYGAKNCRIVFGFDS